MLRVSGGISDEGFNGSRVRDTEDKNRFTKEGADFLVDAIKKATKPIENISQSNKAAISQVAGKIFENLAKNTEQVQAIVESQGDDTINEFNKLVKMMAAAQTKTGEASVSAIKELIKQIENIKIAAGDRAEELSDSLGGLDTAQKTLSDQGTVRRETFGDALFKKATGVDKRTESPWKAFSMEKMFGLDPGTGNILEQAKQEAIVQSDIQAKVDGEAAVMGAVFPASETESTNATTPPVKSVITNATTPPVKSVITNAEGGDITAGIDRESPQNKQVELLEQILAQLKGVEEAVDDVDDSSITDVVIGAGAVAAIVAAMPAILAGLTIGAAFLSITAIINALSKNKEFREGQDAQIENMSNSIAAGFGASKEDQARRAEFASRPIERAKTSGLYDKDWVGNSEVDLNMLAESNDTAQLQAILDDNDLSDNAVMQVTKRMEQIERGELAVDAEGAVRPNIVPYVPKKLGMIASWMNGLVESDPNKNLNEGKPGFGTLMLKTGEDSILDGVVPDHTSSPTVSTSVSRTGEDSILDGVVPDHTSSPTVSTSVSPTGDAVYNTLPTPSDVGTEVNNYYNTTNNQGGQGGFSASPILVNADGARNGQPSFIRFQDKQF